MPSIIKNNPPPNSAQKEKSTPSGMKASTPEYANASNTKSARMTPIVIGIVERKPRSRLVLMMVKKTGPSAKLNRNPIGIPYKKALMVK